MVQAFLFAASILLCLELVGSLYCNACLYELDGTCLAGRRMCIGRKRCVAITVSLDGFQQFHTYGCFMPQSYFCGMTKIRLNGQRTTVNCCWRGNFCNARLLY